MKEFKSFLKPKIEKFIEYRIISGQWNSTYETNLHLFDKYVLNHYPCEEQLTQEMVYGWCSRRSTETSNSCRARTYEQLNAESTTESLGTSLMGGGSGMGMGM